MDKTFLTLVYEFLKDRTTSVVDKIRNSHTDKVCGIDSPKTVDPDHEPKTYPVDKQ